VAALMIGFFACGTNAGGGDDFQTLRARMVADQIAARGVRDKAVLDAMKTVPRHQFVPAEHAREAYADYPLPIGYEQTISQPYIVAYMTEALQVKKGGKVLEIGTGSGYQAAVLAEMGVEVYSIEIVEPLANRASVLLKNLGYKVHVKSGDGYMGWPEAAPFDGIIVTAAPEEIPPPLKEQLKEGGRIVVPVGRFFQDLKVLKKQDGKLVKEKTLPVRFVPMTGKASQ
jgi:protein-L-isoaspartate(D-aspartate) O-methyltransferase